MTSLIEVTDLSIEFPTAGGGVRAVDGLSFTLVEGIGEAFGRIAN
ncbi:MAG: hypothetical protein QOI83_1683, partial [Streptomycetaceae bacterium]|nr:hypothetical protein [Streptomycetaceae bacterium]